MEAIPVLMYHSVAPEIQGWVFKHLSIHPDIFEDHIAALAASGYNSISLSDLFAYVSRARDLPPRSVALTFDDGYLDNWVFAFPILKKYGFKATIFVSTDFIDRRDLARQTLEDVWSGRCDRAGLTPGGFLGLREIKAMMASGLIDIQAHCKTHTWYFTGRTVVDFHHPGDAYPWLAWNARPERKHLYIEEDQTELVPLGSPVYEHEKSLLARRYFPDPRVGETLARHVAVNGGAAFFARSDWKQELHKTADKASEGALDDSYETEAERKSRFEAEIASCKHELTRLLDKPIDFLCWPGGAYDETAVGVAEEAGYLAWTLASRLAGSRRNLPGEDPEWIRRLPAAPWWIYRGRRRCAVDGKFLVLMLEEYKGLALSRFRLRSHKLRKLLGSYLHRDGR
jgi:peptidoglycan/xylan/chitin deacetylase (PgdA/CDA1 family)